MKKLIEKILLWFAKKSGIVDTQRQLIDGLKQEIDELKNKEIPSSYIHVNFPDGPESLAAFQMWQAKLATDEQFIFYIYQLENGVISEFLSGSGSVTAEQQRGAIRLINKIRQDVKSAKAAVEGGTNNAL